MKKMFNICVIGAGQLGSRHLQALALVKEKINIQVVDPGQDSLKTAQQRFSEVAADFSGSISFHSSIADLSSVLDVVIIATNSKVRRAVVEELVKHKTVKNLILEKFLFPTGADYSAVRKIIVDKRIKTWVNCPRRMVSFYQNLSLSLQGPVHFSASGNAWGLGSNGIHLLDLFAFLTRSNELSLSGNLLDSAIIESKRPGYIEFSGSITGHSAQNSLRITSFNENPSALQITISSPTVNYYIKEGAKSEVIISKQENGWVFEKEEFTIPFQSHLTNIVVDDILKSGTCALTEYRESEKLHVQFLNLLLQHLRKVKYNNTIQECLIT